MSKYVRPAKGLTVPMPGGGVLSGAGAVVNWSPFWARRLADGDVEIVERGSAKSAKGAKEMS